MADILIEKSFEVHGVVRRSSSTPNNLWRIAHALGRVTLHEGDVLDASSIGRVVAEVRPLLAFNMADQDQVGYSRKTIGYSLDVTGAAVGRMLEVVRQVDPGVRWFQPLSVTMFGDRPAAPVDERTPLCPMSPYAIGKAAAWHICRYFREYHGMRVASAIFAGHDSPRRAPGYLLQKICRGAAAIARGEQESLALGNLSQRVDVGYAKEYAGAAYEILRLSEPQDFVIGSGQAWTIREMVECAFRHAGVTDDPGSLVTADPEHHRYGVPPLVVADCAKARRAFGWEPKVGVGELIGMLVGHFLGRGAR